MSTTTPLAHHPHTGERTLLRFSDIEVTTTGIYRHEFVEGADRRELLLHVLQIIGAETTLLPFAEQAARKARCLAWTLVAILVVFTGWLLVYVQRTPGGLDTVHRLVGGGLVLFVCAPLVRAILRSNNDARFWRELGTRVVNVVLLDGTRHRLPVNLAADAHLPAGRLVAAVKQAVALSAAAEEQFRANAASAAELDGRRVPAPDTVLLNKKTTDIF